MLFAKPTRYGAGVELWGDPRDLEHLRDTVYHLADAATLGEQVSDFLLELAYDVRHAFQRDRLEREFGVDSLDKVACRGVQIVWPIFLVQVSLLRRAAGLKPTTGAHQADIYRLEYEAEQALVTYDAAVGGECVPLIPLAGDLPRDYLVEYISCWARDYVEQGSAGKARFKKLPVLLRSLWWVGDEYKAFAAHLKTTAAEQGCQPSELTDGSKWREFRW